jgi:hypothetical protein
MKLHIAAAAAFAAALPAAPALAHCNTVHHRVAARKAVHRVAYVAPVRRHAVRTACACGRGVAHRSIVYREAPAAYRPRLVSVTYERALYRPYRPVYVRTFYRPRPVFYGARYERFPRHRFYAAYGFRRDRFERFDGFRRHDRYDGFRRHDRYAWR